MYFRENKMFEKKPEFALVLSGGGARGAYEIGAWKALRELKMKFNAICGTSVGALNAAVIAQGDFELGLKIWSEITIDKVVNVPDGILKNGRIKFNLKNLRKIGDLNLNIRNIGLDSKPLQNLLKTEVNEYEIRKKGIDLGLVTININTLKPCEIFLEDMPEGSLADYLLASASFPAFRRAEINGQRFADGAMYDNIPHAMAKNRGYRRIVVIDIGGLGVNKKPDISGTDTVYIETSLPLGNILDFNPENALKAINAGYLDTMKVFGRNDGIKYFIIRDIELEEKILKQLHDRDEIEKYSKFLKPNGRKCIPENAEILIREVMPPQQRSHKNIVLCLAESAAAALDVERNKLYRFSELIEAIRQKYSWIIQSGSLPTKKESESFFKMIEHTIGLFSMDREIADFSPYEYAKIMRSHRAAENLFPELAAAEIFLSMIIS
jgi:NTE family protein